MTFLHIADLHIGKTVSGFSMLVEQANALNQVEEMLRDEKPAALVIAGDVYDKPFPPVDAVGLFDEFLTRVSETGTPVLIVPGNHDSAERLSFARRLLSENKVFIAGAYSHDKSIIEVPLTDEYGDVVFHLAPFIRPSINSGKTFQAAFEEALAKTNLNDGRRHVLVAHQFFVPGSGEKQPERSGSEQNILETEASANGPRSGLIDTLGGIDAISVSVLKGFAYTALGHLHAPQNITSDTSVRYAGSPVKYSKSEAFHKKSASLVTIGKSSAAVKELPFTPVHDMRSIKGPFEELVQAAGREAPADDYIYAAISDRDAVYDAMPRLRAVYPNIMNLVFERETPPQKEADEAASSDAAALETPENQTPEALFASLFEKQMKRPLTPEESAFIAKSFRKGESDEAA
jgi:exonuclease SbcD